MKNLFLLAILLIASVAVYPQERQAGIGASYSRSKGTGNADGLGVRFDLVLPVDNFFAVVAQAQWEREEKLYIGDGSGSAWRGRVEGRIHFTDRASAVSPFVSVGLSGVNQRTSQYTKSALTWTGGAGVVIKQHYVGYWKRYFPEKSSPNQVSANEYGASLYLPVGDASKWLWRSDVAIVRTKFYQPSGINKGDHLASAILLSFGVGRKF